MQERSQKHEITDLITHYSRNGKRTLIKVFPKSFRQKNSICVLKLPRQRFAQGPVPLFDYSKSIGTLNQFKYPKPTSTVQEPSKHCFLDDGNVDSQTLLRSEDGLR